VLERIEVEGKTDVPNFVVGNSGHPVHLTTDFTAVVDGTNGDTGLSEVRASYLNTRLIARGMIEGKAGRKGKTVRLKVGSEQARIEDLVSLVVPQDSPLTGAAEFHTSFELPPGDADVLDRLQLNGSFGLEQTTFSKNELQRKVAKLSARAQGNKSMISNRITPPPT
jgi:hypothetical protein